MKKDLISIVTISYNHEKFIADAINSFLMQKHEDFDIEIIIADDASTDETQKIISDYAKKHPKLIRPVLRKKNLGVRDNLIDAMNMAKGKYIALCEGDDFWTSELKLTKQYDYMELNNNATICFHLVSVMSGEDNNSVFPDLSIWSDFSIEQLLDHNFIQTNSVMYRNMFAYKDIIVGDPLPLDWFLHIYHAKNGEIGFIPELLAAYRRHEDGVWWRTESSKTEFWKKNILKLMMTYDNISNLYNDDLEKKRIVETSRINQIISLLEDSNENDGKSAIEQINATYPNLMLSGGRILVDKINLIKAEVDHMTFEHNSLLEKIAETQELVRERDSQIEKILNSRIYKTGHIVTMPLRLIKKTKHKLKKVFISLYTPNNEAEKAYDFEFVADPKSKLAVIVHLYYIDVWQEISKSLKVVSEPFDLYVSVIDDINLDLGKINKFHKRTNIVRFPNRGRDVLPFLMIIKRILKARQYEYILKIHTKKSKHRQDGADWFMDILQELLPSKLDNVFAKLRTPETGIIGPSKQVVSLSRYFGDNAKSFKQLIIKLRGKRYAQNVIDNLDKYPFIGGTMFWGRADYFSKLCKLPIKPTDFESEQGQVDGTLAHAIERALGMAMHGDNKVMYVVDEHGDVRQLEKTSYTDAYERVG